MPPKMAQREWAGSEWMKPLPTERRPSFWTVYVASGPSRDDRAVRLSEVPEVMRDAIRQEVIWYFQRIKNPA